jgi:hypothetical protein
LPMISRHCQQKQHPCCNLHQLWMVSQTLFGFDVFLVIVVCRKARKGASIIRLLQFLRIIR